MRKFTFLLLLAFICLQWSSAQAQNLLKVSLTPITKDVVALYFDEGYVENPTQSTADTKIFKEELNINLAETLNTYSISSEAEGFGTVTPEQIGRKSKGREYTQVGLSYDFALKGMKPNEDSWISIHYIYLKLPKSLTSGEEYTISFPDLNADQESITFTFNEVDIRSEAVHVNTLGYGPNHVKYGYVYQWGGTLGAIDFSAYDGKPFYLVDETGAEVFDGELAFRKAKDNPETGQSIETPDDNFLGSDVYEADFSAFTGTGTFKLVVEGMGASYPFKIGEDPVWDAYRNTFRALYLQRNGIRIEDEFTTRDAYTGETKEQTYIRPVNQNPLVTDPEGTSYAGKVLYSDFSFMSWQDPNLASGNEQDVINAGKDNPLEVSGWYHDAGDWDAYYTHQRIPSLLMTTWEYLPNMFADNEMDIPESGNGLPDVLDEASWLVKFNYRQRKELMAKGYSDGGVGGARVCADPEGHEPEQNGVPSWQDPRNTYVTQVDAFMTYTYSSIAAQWAIVLLKNGQDPTKGMVELLDAAHFEDMTYEEVNWIKEAEEAFDWAVDPAHQPASGKNYDHPLWVHQTNAAVNLYRLTGKEKYHSFAKEGLNNLKNSSSLREDERFAVYNYFLADNFDVDEELKSNLRSAITGTAEHTGVNAAQKRATRWGGIFDMPMLIGHISTPWMFENVVAYAVSGDSKFAETVYTTCDYFLGTNPEHSTWMTHVGPRPVNGGFLLDARHLMDNWDAYPGWVPYGPWRFREGYEDQISSIVQTHTGKDGVERIGGKGPWNEHWHNFSMFPVVHDWPGHERYSNNYISPMASENTCHQNSVHAAISYGFTNGRHFDNNTAAQKIGSLVPSETDITNFQYLKESRLISVANDNAKSTISALKWSSSNPDVAYVDQNGRITAIADGEATITVSTLDGLVTAEVVVVNSGLVDRPVEEVKVTEESIELIEGETRMVKVEVLPEDAADRSIRWESADEQVAIIKDGEIMGMGAGTTVVKAISVSSPEIMDEITVMVKEGESLFIADGDEHLPVIQGPAAAGQNWFFGTGGQVYASVDNPSKDEFNGSEKVIQYSRPSGGYKVFGFQPNLNEPYSSCAFDQIEFHFFGAHLTEFRFEIEMIDESKEEFSVLVTASDKWQTLNHSLPANKLIKTIYIYPETSGNAATDLYMDNVRLKQNPHAEDCGKSSNVRGILDFEDIVLNWNPYGAVGWAGRNVAIVDNILTVGNPSEKVFYWGRDGSNAGGGFFIRVPRFQIAESATLRFKIYSTVAFQQTLVSLQEGDSDLPGFVKADYTLDAGVAAGQWVTLEVPLMEMSVWDMKEFSDIVIQPGLGSSSPMTIYVDDIELVGVRPASVTIDEEMDLVLEVGEEKTINASVLPLYVSDEQVIYQSGDETIATVSEDGKVTAIKKGETVIMAYSAMTDNIYDEIAVLVEEEDVEKPEEPILDVDVLQNTKVHPNPFANTLTLSSPLKIHAYKIIDVVGKAIQAKEITPSKTTNLELTALPQGVYIIELTLENQARKSFRVVKK